jgi:hypothetical protein
VLCAVIVVLAIRPWGGTPVDTTSNPAAGGSPAATMDGGEGAVASGAPSSPGIDEGSSSPPLPPPDPLRETCGSPSGWRAATLQAWAGRTEPIRSWIAIEPVAASGPLDPEIPFAPVATGIVTAIGYCAPLGDERPPAVASTSLWAIRDGVATPLSLVPLEPASPNALGGLWLAPPEVEHTEPAPGGLRLWPPGRYAIRIAAPSGAYDRWLGVEIADLSLLHVPVPGGVSPSPGSSSP